MSTCGGAVILPQNALAANIATVSMKTRSVPTNAVVVPNSNSVRVGKVASPGWQHQHVLDRFLCLVSHRALSFSLRKIRPADFANGEQLW